MNNSSKTPGQLEDDVNAAIGAKVRATLYMLSHVAVDPRHTADMREGLKFGVVTLSYFRYSNPARPFELEVGSPDWARIRQAFEANAAGPLVDAAQRVLKWQARPWGLRTRSEDGPVKRLRDAVVWPEGISPVGYMRTSAQQAKIDAVSSKLTSSIAAKEPVLRDRRNARLAVLAEAAAPGIGSWHQLLESAASYVPPGDLAAAAALQSDGAAAHDAEQISRGDSPRG